MLPAHRMWGEFARTSAPLSYIFQVALKTWNLSRRVRFSISDATH